jgi:hypothetical protein
MVNLDWPPADAVCENGIIKPEKPKMAILELSCSWAVLILSGQCERELCRLSAIHNVPERLKSTESALALPGGKGLIRVAMPKRNPKAIQPPEEYVTAASAKKLLKEFFADGPEMDRCREKMNEVLAAPAGEFPPEMVADAREGIARFSAHARFREFIYMLTLNEDAMTDSEWLRRINRVLDEVVDLTLEFSEPDRTDHLKKIMPLREKVRGWRSTD